MSDAPFRILFALYPRLTQLDFTGPFEVFARLPGAEVVMASRDGGPVRSDTALELGPTRRLAEVDACDLICVPGGPGIDEATTDPVFLAEIGRLAAGARYVTSVCTGSLILGAAGLLRGKRAASHWAWRDLVALFGATPDPARVVRDGRLITGGGVTAGIDLALTVAAEVAGVDVASAIQLTLEYAPAPPFDAGRPETAGQEIVDLVTPRFAERRKTFSAEHG
jgi:transcriptional regulator GlxA family with amidase domain